MGGRIALIRTYWLAGCKTPSYFLGFFFFVVFILCGHDGRRRYFALLQTRPEYYYFVIVIEFCVWLLLKVWFSAQKDL